jgi:hypothetical protein
MTYAVMQKALEPPLAEQLRNAFQQVPGLTALDVTTLGRDAFGVLMKGGELEQATALQSALAAQGVETEVVEDTVLAELPTPRLLTKVVFTSDGLGIYDVLGRCVPLQWNSIEVIAAGKVRVTEFKHDLVSNLVTRSNEDYGALRLATQAVTKEAQADHLLLEILTTGAAARYHAIADRPEAHLLFQSLGERRGKDAAQNLALFVQDLAKAAPGAVLNHGAYFMCEEGDPSFAYPSRTAFYREIAWLLWMDATGQTPP